jgi:hypothetical protein
MLGYIGIGPTEDTAPSSCTPQSSRDVRCVAGATLAGMRAGASIGIFKEAALNTSYRLPSKLSDFCHFSPFLEPVVSILIMSPPYFQIFHSQSQVVSAVQSEEGITMSEEESVTKLECKGSASHDIIRKLQYG